MAKGNSSPNKSTQFKKGNVPVNKNGAAGLPQKWKGLAKEKLAFTERFFLRLKEEKKGEDGVSLMVYDELVDHALAEYKKNHHIFLWILNLVTLQEKVSSPPDDIVDENESLEQIEEKLTRLEKILIHEEV